MKIFILGLLIGGGFLGKGYWETQKICFSEGFKSKISMERQLSLQLIKGVFGGLRPAIADIAWIRLTYAWDRQQWFRVYENIKIATRIQPESEMFWEVGSWYLAWNAALSERRNLLEKPQKRLQNEKYWVQEGQKLLKEGLSYHPQSSKLWVQLGILHMERTRHYEEAFHAFLTASELPGARSYVARLAGNALEKSGDYSRAIAYWESLLDQAKTEGDRAMIEKKLLKLKKPSTVLPSNFKP